MVHAGSLPIGGDSPISIQSMANVPTQKPELVLAQIFELYKAGCELVRVAVPDMESAEALPVITKSSPVPVSADIHFDHRLALASIKGGVAKLRLNPGNIGADYKVREVALAALDANIPIRVGVNFGSVPLPMKNQSKDHAKLMVDLAEKEIELLISQGFTSIVVSLKARELPLLIRANQLFSERFEYPLHIGVTEAGFGDSGIVRSSVGIGAILAQGIGDTIRVSLSGSPVSEIPVCKDILRSLGLRKFAGADITSCPTCARTRIDVAALSQLVAQRLSGVESEVHVAVMGCEVNGPGEARDADAGIAGGNGFGILFVNGKPPRKIVGNEALLDALVEEVLEIDKNRRKV